MSYSPTNQLTLTFNFNGRYSFKESFLIEVAPFNTGTWVFEYQQSTKVVLSCVDVTSSVRVDSVELRVTDGSTTSRVLSAGLFPPSSDWNYTNSSINYYNSQINSTLTVKFSPGVKTGSLPYKLKQVASRHTPLLNSPSPNDVVFYFPRTKRELWANSTSLKAASSYFVAMFDSGFTEGTATARKSNADQLPLSGDVDDDSDIETDSIAVSGARTRSSSSIAAGVKEVVVKDAAYTTYRAVLTYIHSGHITFAPLTPPTTTALSRKDVVTARTTKLKSAAPDATTPLAASAKSIYKLVTMFELPELADLALNNFKLQLTPGNVLYQLMTEIALHGPVRDELVAFAAANWQTVSEMEEIKELDKMSLAESLLNPLVVAVSMVAVSAKCKRMSVS